METNSTPKQKFDDWTEVKECSNCQRWWNDQCDGTLQGSVRPCKDFLATRSVRIPEELESFRTQIDTLKVACFSTGIILVIHLVLDILGG